MTVIDFTAFIGRLATASGETILPFFRTSLSIDNKSTRDFDPVTEADRAAEAVMRRLIKANFPQHGIVGEEFGSEREDAEYVWVLDPIDGTTSFIAGRPIFGTLIALTVEGWPVLGVIDQPIAKERWVGVTGKPTLFNGGLVRARTCPALDQALLATTGPHYFTDGEAVQFLALASKVARRRIIYGGDCYNYGLLASGHVDCVVEAGLKLHDFAALIPIVEGAGGMMCDWAGEPLNADSAGNVIALGDPARLEDVLETLAFTP